VLKSEVVPADDGQRAKGLFLYQLTGKQPVTNCDGKEVRKLRYRFYRTDFEAVRGVNGWRFTTFETAASEEARQIKVDRMQTSLKPFMADPKKTAEQKARRLADVSFFYYMHEDLKAAADAARRSLAVYETASGHSSLAHALRRSGQYDDAIAHYKAAALRSDYSVPTKYVREWIRECKVRKMKVTRDP